MSARPIQCCDLASESEDQVESQQAHPICPHPPRSRYVGVDPLSTPTPFHSMLISLRTSLHPLASQRTPTPAGAANDPVSMSSTPSPPHHPLRPTKDPPSRPKLSAFILVPPLFDSTSVMSPRTRLRPQATPTSPPPPRPTQTSTPTRSAHHPHPQTETETPTRDPSPLSPPSTLPGPPLPSHSIHHPPHPPLSTPTPLRSSDESPSLTPSHPSPLLARTARTRALSPTLTSLSRTRHPPRSSSTTIIAPFRAPSPLRWIRRRSRSHPNPKEPLTNFSLLPSHQ